MSAIADNADLARDVAIARPYANAVTAVAKESIASEWATLFARNFDGRRALFGTPALGKDNIRMVEIAREVGASAKFPGSGGAVVGVVDVAGVVAAGRLPFDAPSLPLDTAEIDAQEAIATARVAAATEVLRAAYHAEGYVFIRLEPFDAEESQSSL